MLFRSGPTSEPTPEPTTPPSGGQGGSGGDNGGGKGNLLGIPGVPAPSLPALPSTGVKPVDTVLTYAQAVLKCTLEGYLPNLLVANDPFDQCVYAYTHPDTDGTSGKK